MIVRVSGADPFVISGIKAINSLEEEKAEEEAKALAFIFYTMIPHLTLKEMIKEINQMDKAKGVEEITIMREWRKAIHKYRLDLDED